MMFFKGTLKGGVAELYSEDEWLRDACLVADMEVKSLVKICVLPCAGLVTNSPNCD